MSLQQCRSCTTQYPVDLTACPHCGNDAERFAVPVEEPADEAKPKRVTKKQDKE